MHRLVFTSTFDNTDVPLIAADAVHNLRSALDHLAAALVPPKRRNSVMFPIFCEGVWDDDEAGENKQRADDRQRWRTTTRHMTPHAVGVLKVLQPPERAPRATQANFLRTLNLLSNKDKHSNLPVTAQGLQYPGEITWTNEDGTPALGRFGDKPGHMVEHEAAIDGLPQGARNVEIKGALFATLRLREPKGHIEMMPFFRGGLELIRSHIVSRADRRPPPVVGRPAWPAARGVGTAGGGPPLGWCPGDLSARPAVRPLAPRSRPFPNPRPPAGFQCGLSLVGMRVI